MSRQRKPARTHLTFCYYPHLYSETEERESYTLANESRQWVQKHRGGFIFVRWLQNDLKKPDIVVGLFATVDTPHQLVVIKKLTKLERVNFASNHLDPMAAEIEHCSLSTADPLVQRQLPLYHDSFSGRTPFPQMHAFMVHELVKPPVPAERVTTTADGKKVVRPPRRLPHDTSTDTDITLFYKYYNGGRLKDLLDAYHQQKRRVPEGFIWHFLAELGRALSWMHTGRVRSREFNLHPDNRDNIGKGTTRVNRAVRPVPGWEPLLHHDMHIENIWLHYPTEEERRNDPTLARFTDELPQIILGDWGWSFQGANDRVRFLPNKTFTNHKMLRDKLDLGTNLLRLITAGTDYWQRVDTQFGEQDTTGKYDLLRQKYTLPEVGHYSRDLGYVWDRFLNLTMLGDPDGDYFAMVQKEKVRPSAKIMAMFPNNDFTYARMIALADKYLESYAGSADAESVRWTQPKNTYMPFHDAGMIRRNPALHRWDWSTVYAHMRTIKVRQFAAYRLGCVAIRHASFAAPGRRAQEMEPIEPPEITEDWYVDEHGPDGKPTGRTFLVAQARAPHRKAKDRVQEARARVLLDRPSDAERALMDTTEAAAEAARKAAEAAETAAAAQESADEAAKKQSPHAAVLMLAAKATNEAAARAKQKAKEAAVKEAQALANLLTAPGGSTVGSGPGTTSAQRATVRAARRPARRAALRRAVRSGPRPPPQPVSPAPSSTSPQLPPIPPELPSMSPELPSMSPAPISMDAFLRERWAQEIYLQKCAEQGLPLL